MDLCHVDVAIAAINRYIAVWAWVGVGIGDANRNDCHLWVGAREWDFFIGSCRGALDDARSENCMRCRRSPLAIEFTVGFGGWNDNPSVVARERDFGEHAISLIDADGWGKWLDEREVAAAICLIVERKIGEWGGGGYQIAGWWRLNVAWNGVERLK